VDDKSLDQEFNTTLMDLQMQGVNMNKIRGGKQGQQRVAEAVAMESANRLLTRRTLERLKAIATGEYKSDEKISDVEVKNEEAASRAKTGKAESSKGSRKASLKSGKTIKAGASKKTSSGSKSKSTIKKSPSKK
jgi:hypothetical protein